MKYWLIQLIDNKHQWIEGRRTADKVTESDIRRIYTDENTRILDISPMDKEAFIDMFED